jgi:6-phosphogluconolactonase (cycloisomerase 2 family)/sugar lactone lactonase YvrE
MTTQSAASAPSAFFGGFQQKLILALCGVVFATFFPYRSSAQQVSYYDFNTPATASPSQSSTSCGSIAGGPAASDVFFCFNSVGAGLSFLQDSYPPSIDPNANTDGDTGSTNYALQVTENAGSQASSMWYSVPQNVANGFTLWYAVKINYSVTPSNYFTGDGFAFVIQNAAGGAPADPVSSCSETGSHFTVLGGGGGCLGYGGIDNSVALEMDTFWDSYDPEDYLSYFGYPAYDDNHIALQSCGPANANSPAHLSTPNCLITLNGASTLVSNPHTSAAPPTAVVLDDGNPHQMVVVYNGPNDSPANYIYAYLDPAFNPGTHTPVAGSTPLFSGPFDITQHINLNNGTAYIGFTAATGGDYEQHELMGFTFTPHGYATANVCPLGQNSPAPCNSTVPVTFNFTQTTTVSQIQVVTQGTPGLDFTAGSGSNCINTFSSGSSCTVYVTFAPLAPGLRLGAVELLDASGNVLATKLISGIGQGPAITFGPGTQTTVNTGSYTLNIPKGVAVDAAGNLFIADNGNARVLKVAANGTQTVVYGPTPIGFPYAFYPQGLAVDGAGNLFVADNNRNVVVEVPAGCNSISCQITLASNLNSQLGVAVDGAGDLFVGSFNGHEVVEIPAGCTTSTCQNVVYSGSTSSEPVGVAVDAAGDLFVADFGLAKVVEVPVGCTTSVCQIVVGSGWASLEGVAVDAAGDLFVTDAELDEVVEFPAGCTSNGCRTTVASGIQSLGVAPDGAGNIFIADNANNRLVKFNRSQPPSLSFANTNVGSTSSDSPQSVTIQNIGNQALNAVAPGLVVAGPNFVQVAGTGTPADCTGSFALAAGATCNLSLSFEPQSPGNPLTTTAVFTDNALNAAPATQSLALSGVGVQLALYTIGGSVTGVAGSGLVLQDEFANNLPLSSNGPFTFPGTFSTGTPYSVTVLSSPVGQNCTVTNGSGTVANANVSSIQVSCITTLIVQATSLAKFAGNPNPTLTYTVTGFVNGDTSAVLTGAPTLSTTATQNSPTGSYPITIAPGTLAAPSYYTFTFVNGTMQIYAAPPSLSVIGNQFLYASNFFANVVDGYSVNSAGSLIQVPGSEFTAGQGGVGIAVDPLSRFVYVTDNTASTISGYTLNAGNGSLTPIAGSPFATPGILPVSIAVEPQGKFLYVQSISGIDVFSINQGSGALTLLTSTPVPVGPAAQFDMAITPNGKFLFSPNSNDGQGGATVSSFAINPQTGALTPAPGSPYSAGSGALSVAVDPLGRFLYVGEGWEATNLFAFSIDQGTGALTPIPGSPFSAVEGRGLAVDPLGRFLFISDEDNGQTSAYTINPSSGAITAVAGSPFSGGGAGATVDRTGNFLYVGNYGPNALPGISAFQVNQTTGALTQLSGSPFLSGNSPYALALASPLSPTLASSVQQNFGNVNVCPAGQNTPAPCSTTAALTYNLTSTTTLGAIQVVTLGATGLDFTLGTGSTCTGTVSGGGSCTVNVKFAPLAPGLRMGAVKLFDISGDLLATTPVYGIGQGPEIAFGPGVQSTVASIFPGGLVALAEDGAGDIFIADSYNSQVVKVPAGGGAQTTVGSGLNGPEGVTVDGAGNVFIADSNNGRVVEVPANCTSANCQTVVASGLNRVTGMAADGAGNVFVAEGDNGQVLKIPAGCVNVTCQTVVVSGLSNPIGIALDAAGDLFIANLAQGQVLKVPAGCASSSCQSTVGSGLSQPYGVAVDGAGDVFIADENNNQVVEVPPGCTSVTCQSTVGSGLSGPEGVAVDGAGHIFIADTYNNRVVEVNRSQLASSFSFAITNTGSTSTDSPQSVSVQNVGNQPLTGSLGLTLGSNFSQGGGCVFPLAPGAVCNLSFSFTPSGTGYLTATAIFSSNSLNNSSAAQTLNLSGLGQIAGQGATVAVPNVVGQTQAAATTTITSADLALGTVTTTPSATVASGSVISSNPAAGSLVSPGSAVELLVSTGQPQAPSPNPLSLENNYFVTGDYASAGVTLRGTGVGGTATGTITIPNSGNQGVPDGADIIDAFLYWETLENTPSPSSTSGTFRGYPITGQQIGSDLPNYTDGAFTGTLRAYRADVNTYFAAQSNGVRFASGTHTVSLPDGHTALPLTEGASLVVIYRVLSPNFPLKAVIIYDGSAVPATTTTQVVQGFYDALGGNGIASNTTLFAAGGSWNNSFNSVTLAGHATQSNTTLNTGSAYAAVIFSTPVTNSDNDGILDAWKTGPGGGDFHAGQPGYYDVKTGSWVSLPGALHGEKDLFVQLDYMCGAVLSDGSCDPTQENLFPSPDANGDPLAMVTQAFASTGIVLHLQVGNAVPETTCTDNLTTTPPQLCQFPNQPGVIGWKNSLEFSKLWPRNLASCAAGGDCSTRFPYGQKDSYHYVLFGHSLAIPAWNTRYGTLTSINVLNGVTTIVTADRGTGINACPSRITIAGVLGNPSLNGVYNTTGCNGTTTTIVVPTPGVPNWSYPNSTLPEPVIGLTSGTITSISGYSDLGGADSAVTLGLWLTAPNQNMSKRSNVLAGTLFHEIGHTLGLSHGGLYYDTPNSYVPTFEANCKPNYQSVMNYLFQLDLVGPSQSVAFSNQTLNTLNESAAGSVTQLTDTSIPPHPATFPTSAWYVANPPSPSSSAATLHCDGTPITGAAGYRVNASIAPITPPWSNGQDINYDGQLNTQMRGYNDFASLDLRQVGATGGEFASLATVLSFGSTAAPLNVGAGGTVALGSGGTIALGSGGTVTLGSGGNVTLGSGGTITLGSGGTVTLGSGGNVTLGSGGTVTPGSNGTVTLGSGGLITLGSGGSTITLSSGGTVALGSGGTVTLGSGGTIALGSGGTVTIPSTGGSYTLNSSGGTITLGSGGNVTLGSGGNVTLGSGGTIALGSGGNVTLGSGGNVTVGSGGTIAVGSGGTIALGSGGNVTLGSGGTIALGSGGTITLGSGGNVTLGSGGTVTLGSGGTIALGSGGNVTLGSGGTATLGSGGTVTLGSGGNVTLGSGGNVTLGSGGTIALGSGGNVTLGSGGSVITVGSGGTVILGSGGTVTLGSGGTIALGSGGTVTVAAGGSYTLNSSGGTITLGSGGNVTLGSGGNVTLGSGGTVALGSGGNVTLGSGGTITLGSGGTITLGSGGTVTLGSGGNVTLGSGGLVTLGSGGTIALGSGGTIALGSGGTITLGSGGATSTELTYDTANSIVRPPSSPTETPSPTGSPATVRVDWTAPLFGVVSTYTISRSSNGATPIVIGSVSGVNGNPPATEFIDTNPDLISQTVVYTIATTLVPDTNGGSRQSPPSPPAVLKNDQTISLGPLPSSVTINTNPPPTVTATAMSAGMPNGLQVSFSATGSCSIGSQSISTATGVSSATVILNTTGSCIITGSQTGSNSFNAANAVSGTFAILPANSTTKSQTINFALLQDVQYGNPFVLSASSNAPGQTVSFAASGPCTTAGTTTGIGTCMITASAPGNATYSAASVTQSFIVFPAVVKVTATNLTSTYGQPLPSLLYTYSGFTNGDTQSVVSGAPALSTTATTGSAAGNYPITVSTGTLSAANYSFLYVSGTLTIQMANQAALTLTTTPLTYLQSETLHVTGGTTNGTVTYNLLTGPCTLVGSTLTANSGTGSCSVTATMAGNTNYNPVTSTPANTVALSMASQTITLTVPASAIYGTSFTATASASSSLPVTLAASGGCSNVGASFTMTSGSVACSVIASQSGNANYSPATTVTKVVAATLATPVITWPTPAQIVAGTPLSATQLNATASTTGTFTYTPASGAVLGVGTQTLSVLFTPSTPANYSTATKTVSLVVFAPTVTMGISTQTQTYQHWTNFVIGPIFTGSRYPTGTVTLYDNGVAVVTLTLGGNGLAYYTANPFNVGANVMTASYSGDSHFAAGVSSPVTITVLPAPVTFTASCWGGTPWTVAYQCTVSVSASTTTQPGGNITYSLDGASPTSVALSGGTAAFTVPTIPAAGSHTLTLNYAAQGNFAAGATITKTFTTAQGQTQLLVTPSNYNPAAGSSVTLSGTATTPSSGIPTGSVTFYDGTAVIGTSAINASTGAVSYTVVGITKGSHSYSAKYAGSTNYTAATSGTSVVTAH